MGTLRSWLGLLGVLAALTAPADAQPVGSEFQINTYTLDDQLPQWGRSIAADADGNFVVVWRSLYQDGSFSGVFGQRFDGAGAPLGAEFRVNTFTPGHQFSPAVAAAPGGPFVVVWHSQREGRNNNGVFSQRYDSGGVPQGDEFHVNSYTSRNQDSPAVAADAAGNFIVVWESYVQDGDSSGIFGQRYDSEGARLGGEFRVNTYTTSQQHSASVAADARGNFVVVWNSYNQGGAYGAIIGQRYDSEGHTLGAEFRVGPGAFQTNPEVASDPAGNFVVVWASYRLAFSYGLYGQRYDSAGVPQGGVFRVNTTRPGNYNELLIHDVASDAAGNFVVIWDKLDPSGSGVFGRAFDSAGVPQSEEFRINAFTTGDQAYGSVAAKGPNEFVVAWYSYGQDGSGYGVFGRRVVNPAGEAGWRVGDQR
jgi:hypothetical protein